MKPFVKRSALMAVMLCLCACAKDSDPALGLDSTSAFATTEAVETTQMAQSAAAAGTETTVPDTAAASQFSKTVEKTQSQTAQQGKNAPAPELKITIKSPVTEQKGYDRETGTHLVLTFSYDSPAITIPGREDISKRINDYLHSQEDIYVSGINYERDPSAPQGYESLLAEAQARYTQCQADGAEFLPASIKRRSELVRADERVVSVLVNSTTRSGSGGSNSRNTAYVFSGETGRLLSFTELAYDQQIFEDFLIDWMVQKAKSDPAIQKKITYFGEALYADRFRDIMHDGSWYLEKDALILFTGDFGGEEAGTVEFRIPFKDLNGMLNTRYQ